MIVYKINVIEAMKEAGYNTTRIRREHIIGENSLQAIREGRLINLNTLDRICKILDMQPGNIIKYVEDEK
jgi:DNA-binding Xre family transcriptional regulator